MKKILIILTLILLSTICYSQVPSIDSIYPYHIVYNINYGHNKNIFHIDIPLFMDAYIPDGATEQLNPVVFLWHGGGFQPGINRTEVTINDLAKKLAGRGYLVFVGDYRVGWKMTRNDTTKCIKNSHQAYYRAIQDGKAAIRFVKYNANLYHADINNIYSGGTSAGALLSLGIAYLDNDEIPSSDGNWQLDYQSNNITLFNGEIKGVIGFWGGVFDSTIIDGGEVEPNILFHGKKDKTVPYNIGKTGGIVPVCGSLPVHNQSLLWSIPSQFITFPNNKHGVVFPSPQWDTCTSFTISWLYQQITGISLKYSPNTINDNVLYLFSMNGQLVYKGEKREEFNNLSDGIYIEKYNGIIKKDSIINNQIINK